IKPFEYGILKQQNNWMYSKDINTLLNTILSGSWDKSVRLWDIRSGQQIQVFDGHTNSVWSVEYSPFVVNNVKPDDSSNVICSGSSDKTIRFWDIRSNKGELYVMKVDDEVTSLKFLISKKKANNNEKKLNDDTIALNGITYNRSSTMNQYQNISNYSSLMIDGNLQLFPDDLRQNIQNFLKSPK
ncbi:hypothetical protein RFI_03751, partial [Reticulomyxa filosa]